MTNPSKDVVDQALSLPARDRASLAEKLLASLDQPDSALDELWAAEAEDRISAYESGGMAAIPAKEVFKKYVKR